MNMTKTRNSKLPDKKWLEYAEDVLSGKILAGKYIKLSAQRYLDWFSRNDIYFNEELMERIDRFVPTLKHFESNWAGKPVQLLPFQRFILANVFAWFYVKSPVSMVKNKRVVEEALIFISRKNGKSALASIIAIVDLLIANGYCNDSGYAAGYEGYCVANSLDQSKVLFKFLRGYTKSIDRRGKFFKAFRNYIQYNGKKGKSDGILKPLASDAQTLDGLNPDLAVVDELHAAVDDSLLEVLSTGMMAKPNALRIIISSGGIYGTEGFPLYDRIQVAHRRMEGHLEWPDNTFYSLFELDEGDDWQDESVYPKANPGYGTLVMPSSMHNALLEAKVNMSKQMHFKIKNLDIFCQSQDIWISQELFSKVAVKVDMSQLQGEYCYAGIDLSSTSDLTSFAICFPPNQMRAYYPDKYILKCFTWVPKPAAADSVNSALYQVWINQGYLKLTYGNSVDYGEMLKDILEQNAVTPIVKVHYDEWNSVALVQQAVAQGLNMVPMSQSLGSFNRGSKSLEIFMNNDQIIIDDNPVTRWCFTNATLKLDMYGNMKPIKPAPSKKIDSLIAAIEAMSGYLFEQLYTGEIFTLDL